MTDPGAWPRLDVVVIGAQKAGSTHIAEVLRRHPDLYMCPDEVPFFEDPFYGNSDPAELGAAVAGAGPAQLRGISRPDYLAHPEVPPRLELCAPDVRLIAVLREPVARALSAYSWFVQFALLPIRPPEEGLADLLDGWEDPRYPHAPDILSFGMYGQHLSRWRECFAAEQLLVLTSDELASTDANGTLFGFLGVDPTRLARSGAERTNSGVYEPRRLRFLQARARFGYSWDSTDRYTYRPRWRRQPLAWLAGAATNVFDRQVLARVWRDNTPPELSPALWRRLRDHYAADELVLAEILGRDPGWLGR